MNDGKQTKFLGFNNAYESNKNTLNIVQLGEVISVDDPNYLGRIKVRIKGPSSRGGDDGVTDENLPWCFPLIPKLLSIQPKVKEAVYLFVFNINKEHADRMYVGPIISQPQHLNFEPYFVSALRGFSFGNAQPNVSVDTIPELTGVFPNPEDVSIQGRYNTDITQKQNEVVIRAGKFETVKPSENYPFNFKFNKTTQAYLQIKNDVVVKQQTQNEKAENGSVVNMVANKINLLTHKDGNPNFNLTNQDNLISDDTLSEILETAHQLPFGDVLLEYLILLKEALFYHVHNGSGNPATDLTSSGNKQAIAAFKAKADDLEKTMLSKNIRIN